MKSARAYRSLFQMLLLGVVLTLSACSKEELDEPHCPTESDETVKSFTTMGQSSGSSSEEAASGGPEDGEDGESGGISDDGDDLSDSEKGRKKKVN